MADPTLAADARAILDAHRARQEFPGAALAVHDPRRGDVLVTSGKTGPAVYFASPAVLADTRRPRTPRPGYGVEEGQLVDYTTRYDPSLGGAASGLQSTAHDVLRFGRALLDGELLDEQRQVEMRTFVPGQPQGDVDHEYGLGLEKYIAGDLELYGHLGSSAAHSAFLGFNPEGGAALAAIINVEDAAPAAYIALEALSAIQ